ncbi:MAG: DMT family transporter [Hyphomicrobiales bacterium]
MSFKLFWVCALDVCAALMFSGIFIFTPLAIGGVGAVGLATQRFVLAAAIFAALFTTGLIRHEKIGRHHWPWLTLAAFLGVFSYNVCMFQGIALSSVVHGGLIVGFTPVMTILFEALLFGMRLNAVKLLGAGISLLGVFYFFRSRLDNITFASLKGNTEIAGDLLFMLAGLC